MAKLVAIITNPKTKQTPPLGLVSADPRRCGGPPGPPQRRTHLGPQRRTPANHPGERGGCAAAADSNNNRSPLPFTMDINIDTTKYRRLLSNKATIAAGVRHRHQLAAAATATRKRRE